MARSNTAAGHSAMLLSGCVPSLRLNPLQRGEGLKRPVRAAKLLCNLLRREDILNGHTAMASSDNRRLLGRSRLATGSC